MPTVTSADGTAIAYEHTGTGPALILVDGAMCYRAAGPMRPLATRLHQHFTVHTYDRRGRGDSGDTPPYTAAREIEDLQALVAAAGDHVYVYAISSGAALALATAPATPAITRLALYEPPFTADFGDPAAFTRYTGQLRELLAAGRRSDAVELFMRRVGVPDTMITGMRAQPTWAALEAIAPTLGYDDAILDGGRLPGDLADITTPALVLTGSASPHDLQQAAKAVADALAGADFETLRGQTHDVHPDAIAPALIRFLTA
jgi:pimeloyl-ACP methyl ester carboxylesterase